MGEMCATQGRAVNPAGPARYCSRRLFLAEVRARHVVPFLPRRGEALDDVNGEAGYRIRALPSTTGPMTTRGTASGRAAMGFFSHRHPRWLRPARSGGPSGVILRCRHRNYSDRHLCLPPTQTLSERLSCQNHRNTRIPTNIAHMPIESMYGHAQDRCRP